MHTVTDPTTDKPLFEKLGEVLLGGAEYTVSPTWHGFQLKWGHAGQGIDVSADTKRVNSYLIQLLWPVIDHREYRPEPDSTKFSIRVSRHRPVEAIANEIRRRLLSNYDVHWNAQCKRAQLDKQNDQWRHASVNKLKSLLGGRPASEREVQTGQFRPVHHNVDTVKVSDNGQKVCFSTYLMPFEVARQVLRLMKQLNPES